MKKPFLFLLVSLLACTPTPTPDITAPATPTGFKAIAGEGRVKLEWIANTEPDLDKYTLRWGSSATAQNATETIAKTAKQFEKTGLTNGITYFFKLEATDATGNTSSSTALLSATPIAPDTTAPTLVSSQPLLNATAIALNAQVQLTFSKAMNISTVTASSNGLTLGAATWNTGNTVVSFVTPALQFDTTYTIALAGKDVAGNDLGGATTLQFSSLSAPPSISSSSPANNAIDVALNSKITLRFSRTMNKTSVETAFSSVPVIACMWVWLDNDQTATCTPNSEFPFATQYDFTLALTAQSTAGIALTSPLASRFTTVQDTIKPALVSFTPTDAQTNVLFSASITLNFSKAMNRTSVESAFVSQPSIACTWTWVSDSSANCQPSIRLDQQTLYTITLGMSATDIVGNTLQAAYGFKFTSGNAPPRVVSFLPSGFGFSSMTAPIVMTFSEDMNKALTQAALQVRNNNVLKAGTITWNPECVLFSGEFLNCKQMTYTPATAYLAGSSITWSVSTSATDYGSGTPLENAVTGGFSTRPNLGNP